LQYLYPLISRISAHSIEFPQEIHKKPQHVCGFLCKEENLCARKDAQIFLQDMSEPRSAYPLRLQPAAND
jgi:hypothetical protein